MSGPCRGSKSTTDICGKRPPSAAYAMDKPDRRRRHAEFGPSAVYASFWNVDGAGSAERGHNFMGPAGVGVDHRAGLMDRFSNRAVGRILDAQDNTAARHDNDVF